MRGFILILLLSLGLGARPLRAQDGAGPANPPAGPTVDRKSPAAARVIGIIPGAGHMYAGEAGRGFAYLGGTVGLLAAGSLLMAGACVGDVLSASADEDCGSDGLENAVTVVVLGFWGWSIYDAGLAAKRTNVRRGLSASLIVAPTRVPTSSSDSGRAAKIGLSIATR